MKIEALNDKDFSDILKRFAARIIDEIMRVAVFFVLSPLFMLPAFHRSMIPVVVMIGLFLYLMTFFMVRYGGTPGKLILGMRIVDESGNFLSLMPALKRLTPEILILMNVSFLSYRIMKTFPGFAKFPTMAEITAIVDRFGGPYANMSEILNFLFYFECFLILFLPRKQSGHDVLAGSYVISKDAWKQLKEL